MNKTERIRGGLYGLLIGDAAGVPYEFNMPADLPAFDQIDMVPPEGFARTHPSVPVGTWSDDGAHALALLESLTFCEELNLKDLGARLVEWQDLGRYAVDGKVFDVGVQTSIALSRLRAGVPPEEAGPSGELNNGNGALMRVLPLALWHQGPDAELVRDAMRQGLPTHGHLRSQVACAFYCLWARAELDGKQPSQDDVLGRLKPHLDDPALYELETRIFPADAEWNINGTGYVVDCLRSAWHVVQTSPDYETTIKRAIALGYDTDTTACVAGGIAGIRYGESGIPERWIKLLREKDLPERLLKRLLQG